MEHYFGSRASSTTLTHFFFSASSIAMNSFCTKSRAALGFLRALAEGAAAAAAEAMMLPFSAKLHDSLTPQLSLMIYSLLSMVSNSEDTTIRTMNYGDKDLIRMKRQTKDANASTFTCCRFQEFLCLLYYPMRGRCGPSTRSRTQSRKKADIRLQLRAVQERAEQT